MSPQSDESLGYRKIFWFWLPLAMTWAMMAIEGPVLQSIVARMAEQKENLAAFGLAHTLAMIVESPIIMLLTASVALVKNRQSFYALRRYGIILNAAVTLLMVIIVLPPFFGIIAHTLLDLPPKVAELMHWGLAALIPWPAAIGYRRFYQGLMIRYGKTRLVAFATVTRMLSMAICALLLWRYSLLPGALIATISLSVAVVLESIATRFMAREVVHSLRADTSALQQLTSQSFVKFYVPLVLTSAMGMAVNPLLSFFISRSLYVLESLAVMPVIDSFVFQFRSAGFSFQETVIALLGKDNMNEAKIRKFGQMMMAVSSGLLTIVAFTPLLPYIYNNVYGLSPSLAEFSVLPTRILFILPALSVLYSLQRGVLINSHRTKEVTISTIIEVSSVLVCMIALLVLTTPVGIIAATLSMVCGRILANVYLNYEYRKCLQGR